METASPPFLLLVLLISVSGVRATLENSEDDFEGNNHRVDAEQDPFTSVSLAAKSGDAISTLFRRCLDINRRPFDAKFASIETPRGTTYTRYVPDSSMLAIPMKWENYVGKVSDIFECASVAEDGDYGMFKYSANACKLATQGYDLEKVPECEDKEVDAVFIWTPTSGLWCRYPSVAVGSKNKCAIFTDKLMTYDDAASFCSSYGIKLFTNEYPDVYLENVTAKIVDLKYTRNIWVGPTLIYEQQWTGNFSPQDWVIGEFPNDGSVVAYLDSKGEWRLMGGQKSALAGAVCLEYH